MKIYNVREAAMKLNVHRSYIYLLVKMNMLKPFKHKPLLFTEEAINEYLKNKEKKDAVKES